MTVSAAFGIAWIAWIVSWVIAAFWRAPTVKNVAFKDVWLYMLLFAVGSLLFFHIVGRRIDARMLWHVGRPGGFALAGIAVLGFLFAWWARIHMGKLWSGQVTLKENHRIVDTGPFALVRHPIYFGLIVALVATGIAKATIPALAGLVLILFGIYAKARLEEKFLRGELGAAYDAYAARIPMLIPFWPA